MVSRCQEESGHIWNFVRKALGIIKCPEFSRKSFFFLAVKTMKRRLFLMKRLVIIYKFKYFVHIFKKLLDVY